MVKPVDINGDGAMDFAFTSNDEWTKTNPIFGYYINEGCGTTMDTWSYYTVATYNDFSAGSWGFSFGDFDNDGDDDYQIMQGHGELWIAMNNLCETATEAPTVAPTEQPTPLPTTTPTALPTAIPTANPTANPTTKPSASPTFAPTPVPTAVPTSHPTHWDCSVTCVAALETTMGSAGADTSSYQSEVTALHGGATAARKSLRRLGNSKFDMDFSDFDCSLSCIQSYETLLQSHGTDETTLQKGLADFKSHARR